MERKGEGKGGSEKGKIPGREIKEGMRIRRQNRDRDKTQGKWP